MSDLKRFIKNGNYYYFGDAPIHISGLALNKSSIALTTVGQTEQLTATISPQGAVETKVVWSSSDETIATVSQIGLVTCVTPGECVITATCGGYSATCSVVEKKDIYIDYLAVGGGGAGGRGMFRSQCWEYSYGGGGGGGQVLMGTTQIEDNILSVVVGSRGVPNTLPVGCICCLEFPIGGNGGNSSIGNYIIAHGGMGGSGPQGGYSGDGCSGGAPFCYDCAGGGGGGAGVSVCCWCCCGGAGLCGYGNGGNGNPRTVAAGSSASVCGGGGGGGGYCCQGGYGGYGLVEICYKTDGSCGISCATGGTITTSGDYTVHRFTSSGDFTIVSQ